MKSALAFSNLLLLLTFSDALSQDILRLESDQPPTHATLADLSWLQGYWVGTGLGGDCDELWLPATDNSMPGIFRFHREGTLVFSEYMMVEAKDSTLSIRLKHFNRDLSPWEDKDRWIEFKLVKIDGQTAYFNGLTYHREGDVLSVKLSMRTRDGVKVEEFRFTKRAL